MKCDNAQPSPPPVIRRGGFQRFRLRVSLHGEPEKNGLMQLRPSENIIEILTLDIKPGGRDEFHQVYVNQSLPLLKKWNFRVLAYGPPLHDDKSYYVIRAFGSL